ncbi:MAG: FkbM family methyltransferase [Gammaproteobacteria bacterium]
MTGLLKHRPFFHPVMKNLYRYGLVAGIVDTQDGLKTVIDPCDGFVSVKVLNRKQFQRREFDNTIEIYNRCSGTKPAAIFLEIGAHIGTHTLYAANSGLFSKVISFEPTPRSYNILKLNIAVNGFEEMISAHNICISDSWGEVQMVDDLTNTGGNRIVQTGQPVTQRHHGTLFTAKAVHGSEYLEQLAIAPADIGLLWIDAEGHEPNVIAGMKRIISAQLPVICMEFTPDRYEHNRMEEMIGFLDGTYDAVHNAKNGMPIDGGARQLLSGNSEKVTDIVFSSSSKPDSVNNPA